MKAKKERDRKYKKGIFNQLIIPFTLFLLTVSILQEYALVQYFQNKNLREKADYTRGIVYNTAETLGEYQAIGWLVDYWLAHYEEMELAYDSQKGAEFEEQFRRGTGYFNLREVTRKQIENVSPTDQMYFAEAVYERCSEEMDVIKRSFGLVYCYSVTLGEDCLRFLVTGTTEDEKRISQGGDLYELGVAEPYAAGAYPVLEKVLETGQTQEDFEKLSSLGGDRTGLVHMYAPVFDPEGNMTMVAAVSLRWNDFLRDSVSIALVVTFFTILLLIGVVIWIRHFLRRIVIEPANAEMKVIREYGEDKDPEKAITGLSLIKSNNELEDMAEDFATMIREIQQYAAEIRDVTAEKERLDTELSIAARIQAAALPAVFPAGKEFELYAYTTPAREVGGDFYDCFFLDERHLCAFVADVSGKGVPGALFMMVAKSLLKTRALQGGSLSEILTDVNEQLLDINSSGMFVTVWIAVIDILTGEGFEANAGHTDPVVKRAGGEYEFLRYRHSQILGILPGVRFTEYALKLEEGDSIFIYTDGVPEAEDVQQSFYGEERMLAALNRDPGAGPQELLQEVLKDIEKFAVGTKQYDDITMFCFRYLGSEGKNQ